MNNIDIDRINELYHKSKSVGLTKAEEAEQKKLRKAYLAAIRKNLRGDRKSTRLNSSHIEESRMPSSA